jgi:hypothetical protein
MWPGCDCNPAERDQCIRHTDKFTEQRVKELEQHQKKRMGRAVDPALQKSGAEIMEDLMHEHHAHLMPGMFKPVKISGLILQWDGEPDLGIEDHTKRLDCNLDFPSAEALEKFKEHFSGLFSEYIAKKPVKIWTHEEVLAAVDSVSEEISDLKKEIREKKAASYEMQANIKGVGGK